jgi:hypothetical protein
MRLRIPVTRVQEALVRLSGLGTIVAQDVSVRDVEAEFRSRDRRIASLRGQIAELRRALENAQAADRPMLQYRLDQARRLLAQRLREERAATQRAKFSVLNFELTTAKGAVAAPAKPGQIERAVRDALAVLDDVVAALLYALIVASPFILLAAVAFAGRQAARRRHEARLLSRA